MSNPSSVQAFGLVRPIIGRAEIMEIRESSGGALFRVPIGKGDQRAVIKIMDMRLNTVDAAKVALEASNAFYQARGEKKAALRQPMIDALKACRAALNSGIAVCQIERKVPGGGKFENINIALFEAEEDDTEEDAEVLAVVHTQGPNWHRSFHNRGDRPSTYTKRFGKRIYTNQCHIVVTDEEDDRPVEIWQLDQKKPVLFTISKKDGLVITAYTATEAEAAEIAAETETGTDVKVIKGTEPERPGPEPTEEQIHCDSCHADVLVPVKDLDANNAKCPACGAPIVVEEFNILRDAMEEIGLTEEQLELLQAVGILNVEDLAEHDGDAVRQALGLKSNSKVGDRLVKAAKKYLAKSEA